MREEVNTILRSINEVTERDISLIEDRERRLKSLLDEVDKRLKVYIREFDARRTATPEAAASPEPLNARAAYQELGKSRYLRSGASLSGASSSGAPMGEQELFPAAPSPDSFPLPSFSVKADEDSSSAGDKIKELLQAGLSPPLIASRLGLSIAEVEFATTLLERREKI